MATSIPIFFIILIAVCSTITTTTTSLSDADRVSDLLDLQSTSASGVIHLTDDSIRRFLTSSTPPRSFHLLLFFDAVQLHEKSELRLSELRREFGLLAQSYIANNPQSLGKIFFCDLEFKESQQSFALFGVNSLPHIRLIRSDVINLKDSEQMDQGDFSRLADSMAEYVEAKTRLTVGPIRRPPMVSKTQIGILIVIILAMTPFAVKKVIAGQTLLHDKKMWLLGSVFVYFFSVSGAMHNIIRKMPMFIVDRNDPTKLQFFYQGSGMQLGAEGFAVGSLYTVVGLLLAMMTHLLVKVKSRNVQTFVMLVGLMVMFWAVKEVVKLDNWKTGYGIHGFWPKSW